MGQDVNGLAAWPCRLGGLHYASAMMAFFGLDGAVMAAWRRHYYVPNSFDSTHAGVCTLHIKAQ